MKCESLSEELEGGTEERDFDTRHRLSCFFFFFFLLPSLLNRPWSKEELTGLSVTPR